MNNRGYTALPIIVLVILAILAFSSAIFIFVQSYGQLKAEISDIGFIYGLSNKEQIARFYVYDWARSSIVEGYKEVLATKKEGDNVSDLNQRWMDSISIKFLENARVYRENELLKDAVSKLEKEGIRPVLDNGAISFSFTGMAFESGFSGEQQKIRAVYRPVINFKMSISSLGIGGFEGVLP